MILKKIKVKNIRSYVDEEISIPEGSTLIAGEIGSGKTSLLLAIEYALFGLQPGQKGNSLLRNRSDTGEVELNFEISGENIIIERGLKRSQKGVANDYAAIIINGERSESSVTEIKSKVISLLGYPLELVKKNNLLYRYTVHTPQEQMKQIILEDPEARINILRHIFGMDRYKQIKENLLILISDLKSKLKLAQGEILDLEKEKERLEIKKTDLKIVDEKAEIERFNLKNKRTDVGIAEKEISELKNKIEENLIFEREVEKTKILIATKKELLYSFTKELSEIKRFLEEETEKFDENFYLNLLSEAKKKKQLIENLNSSFVGLLGKSRSLTEEQNNLMMKRERIFKIDICPTCLQDVSETHKHNIMNDTETSLTKIKKEQLFLETEIESIKSQLLSTKTEIEKLEAEKTRLEILKSRTKEITKYKEKAVHIEKQINLLNSDTELLISHVDSLKEKMLKNSSLRGLFGKKEEELKRVLMQEKEIEIAIAELRKESELTIREISEIKRRIIEKEVKKKKIRELEEIINWLSSPFLNLIETIEQSVLLKIRNEFSSLFRKWFLLLVSDNSLESQIDENFTPIIMQGETEMDYSFLSGGERTAVALAYRLALNQTINSFLSKIKTQGLIILDEPTDGFSDSQIMKMRDIFEELNVNQLIIVSHEQKVESFVDNIVRVVKEGDSSSVQTDTGKSLNTKLRRSEEQR